MSKYNKDYYQSGSPINIPQDIPIDLGCKKYQEKLHNVPPTPGPRSLSNIEDEAKDRFSGIIWMQKDPNRPIEDYFVDYDYWEEYSDTKSYSKRSYQAAYTGRMREYYNYLCILHTDNDDIEDVYYVIAKRIRNELELLEPYCACLKCSSSIINPLKYIWCDHCTKCIKAGPGFASSEYINKAKELKRLNIKVQQNFLEKVLPMISNEYILLGILGLIFIISLLVIYFS